MKFNYSISFGKNYTPCYKPSPQWHSWILSKIQLLYKDSQNRPTLWSAQPILCDQHFSTSSSSNVEHGFLWKGLSFFDAAQKKLKKKESFLIWSRIFLTYWIPHDPATSRFNRWLWQLVYTPFSLILWHFIWPKTETAPSYPCPRQLLICKVRFPISVRIVLAKALPDRPNSRCKKAKNSSLISPSLSTNL